VRAPLGRAGEEVLVGHELTITPDHREWGRDFDEKVVFCFVGAIKPNDLSSLIFPAVEVAAVRRGKADVVIEGECEYQFGDQAPVITCSPRCSGYTARCTPTAADTRDATRWSWRRSCVRVFVARLPLVIVDLDDEARLQF
jgi:hypothetical protein